jgi:hypothetical protein
MEPPLLKKIIKKRRGSDIYNKEMYMEQIRICKKCGIEKPIYEFGKKGKFRYRTECKVCYNQTRRDFNKLSEEEKIKVKEESKFHEEKRLLDSKRKKEEQGVERERNKKLKYEKLVKEYEERMKQKLERRINREKNYSCDMCGETNKDNFYPKRKTKCKRCSLSDSGKYYQYDKMTEKEKKAYIEKNREWISKNIVKVRVSAAKHRSIKKNIPFEITEEIIYHKLKEQDGKCYISKQLLTFKENDWYGLSLDRLNSDLGYTVDNTIVVTKFVNTSKNNLSYDDYIKLLKEVCDNI